MRGRKKEGKADRGREGKSDFKQIGKIRKRQRKRQGKTPTYKPTSKGDEWDNKLKRKEELWWAAKKGRKKQKIGNSRRQDQGTRMNRERLLISKREKERKG